ncbi:alpha/beta fold hydrolase [Cellulomonas sp. JZ18]|uniref:alpha/beta fold hydrolase n=1 Tax=Cellulomonas sp. JZ18 TaxID=2654191 RepID=UPI0018AF9D9F|nr:alpha/beta fold hydrolase [Cellulomonas sp. JZ18]
MLADVAGVTLSYQLHGPAEAPVLVLLHGMGAASDGSSWRDVVPLLAGDHRLVVPDLRGHGASSRPGSYTLDEMADDVARLLDLLGVRDATVVGHSMGGVVAVVLAQARPDLVAALVVEDSSPPPPFGLPPVDVSPPPRPGGPVPYDVEVRPAVLRELGRPGAAWARRAHEVTVPTLVVGGGPTSFVDQDRLAALAARFPAGTMATIDAGHDVHPTRPEEFVALLRRWWAQQGQVAADRPDAGRATVHVRGALTDGELEALHAAAFGGPPSATPWRRRLDRHSLTWVTARMDGRLVGFVNVIGDGGEHAVLLDTCVAPDVERRGVGRALVAAAADEARRNGCTWLHADYEPRFARFYENACGFRPTEAGVLRLV